jgi:tetratricopeptide (TPR) repeat protein
MSLLMQALKKAEHAKQKQSALAESDFGSDAGSNTPQQKMPLNAGKESGELPGRNRTTTARLEPTAPLSRSSVPDAVRSESSLSLSEVESPQPAMTLQLLALPAPNQESADLQSPSAGYHAPESAVEAAPQPVETPAPQPVETQAKTERPSTPRTTEEQKQAAVHAVEKINLAQQKAKSVFASKQPPRSRRIVLIIGGGVIVAILCAGVGFFYWQTSLQDASMVQAQRPIPRPSADVAATAPANLAVVSTVATLPVQGTATASQIATTTSAPGVTPALPVMANNAEPATSQTAAASRPGGGDKLETSGSALNKASLPDAPLLSPRQELSATAPVNSQGEHAEQVVAADKIQIHKSVIPVATNSALTNAYRLFTSGDLNAAKPLYESVLRDDPNNRDALLGMAAIALNQKQTAQAGSLYSRLLDLDPSDPDATAALASLRRGDPEQSESLLKKVLAQNPESGAGLFELGNLYAQQARWADAQQSYFRAYGTAPGNADYAFNLAISLDRLSQNKLALEYYQRALTLAKESPGNFNQRAAKNRIDQLQQAIAKSVSDSIRQ